MELIGKQIAIETILGQPPEAHYPSWYAAQIEKLPPAPPEYLAEQAGILVTDADTISRKAAIDALRAMQTYKLFASDDMLLIDQAGAQTELMLLPPIQPKRGRWIKLDMHRGMADHKCTACKQECYVPTCMGEPMYAFCPNCGAKMEATP